MRVFTFFLPTDTFKKKIRTLSVLYSFGSKSSYICKNARECVKDNKTATRGGSVMYGVGMPTLYLFLIFVSESKI